MTTYQKTTHLPSPQEVREARVSSEKISKYANADHVRISLHGNNETEELVLPQHIVQILQSALSETAEGNAVNLMSVNRELGTQEAADILNVSRPYVVKLMEENKIPHYKVGTHRRVLARDIFAYKQKMAQKRKQTLDELAALSQQEGMGYEV